MRHTFTYPHPFELECGAVLPCLTIAYDTFGERRGENTVWVCHALTANSDVADWWPGTVAEGRFLDPARYFTVCANILGSPYGTTSPLSDDMRTGRPYYGDFPLVTTRDMARAHLLLADHLQIEHAEAIIGSSIGGFQAVEMALLRPDFARKLVLIATAAAATPWLRAFNESQRMAIEADASFGEPRADAAMKGLAAARSIALLSYRGGKAYNATQSDAEGDRLGGYRALSYQRYQGEKLCRRFNAYSYHTLTRALDSHDAGRGRGGLRAALAGIKARTLTVAITTDLLFPPEEMEAMSRMIPDCRMEVIESEFGHDGFLVEADKLNDIVGPFIEKSKTVKNNNMQNKTMKLSDSINVLLLGSGGRENAFARSIAASPRVAHLFIAPGNGGTAALGTNVDLVPTNFAAVKQFVLSNNINLVVVGPEEPLVRGIYDFFVEDREIRHIPVIGPSAQGARLEGSKEFAKEFMVRHGIPTAAYASFSRERSEAAREFLRTLQPPYVLKADGLAAGKGVVIVESYDEAVRELDQMLSGKFGAAGNTVVIEQFLSGIECSVFVAVDGKGYKILPEAKDYKRIGEGDTGLNTGGMGAVSPVPFADEAFMEKVRTRIVEPTVKGLAEEKIDYKGFVFLGLMNVAGDPYVIEYNVRMGDPETEVVLPRIESDIIGLFEGIAFGALDKYELKITPRTAVTVVCVSEGYPGDYRKGLPIEGLGAAEEGDTVVFHAGTALKGGKLLTSGGRVLAVTSLGASIEECTAKSFARIETIGYEGKYFRRDIGKDLL